MTGKFENTVQEGRWTNLTASFILSEAIAKISEVALKVREVAPVTKFITAFIGFGFVSWRQESWLYMFTTPQLEPQATYCPFLDVAMLNPYKLPSSTNLLRHFLEFTSQT